MRNVQPRTGERRHFHVAPHADRFRLRRNSFQSELDRLRSFAHHAAGEERRILAVIDHRKIERAAIIHHLPHQSRRCDGLAVVAHGDDSGILHRGDFRERFAFASHRSRADRPHAHARRRRGAFHDSARHRGIVVHRLRVRHAADGRESAARRRARARLDRFGHFLARLAQVAVKIDEAGRDDQALRVENFCAVRGKIRADFRDALAIEQHVQRRVRSARADRSRAHS